MASTESNANSSNPTVVPNAASSRGGRSRGGRGRGTSGLTQNDREPQRGGRRGRGSSRGRGDRSGGTNHASAMNASDLTARLSQVAASKVPAVQAPGEAEDDEHEVCFLCASDISFHAVPPCNHWTCHVCALRMRALMGNKACSYCKVSDIPSIFWDVYNFVNRAQLSKYLNLSSIYFAHLNCSPEANILDFGTNSES